MGTARERRPSAPEVMLGDLFANGFDIVDEHDESDAIIVNTCGFVEVKQCRTQCPHSSSYGSASQVITAYSPKP